MKKLFKILRLSVSLLLTAAIINIYVTDSYCSFEKEVEHQHASASEFDEHQHQHSNTSEANHHDNGNKDDNCCKDISSAFFSSIINHSINLPVFKNGFTAFVINVVVADKVFHSINFSSKGFIIREAPPPRIPDVRVFIQSFII